MTLPAGMVPIARLRAVIPVPVMRARLCAGFPSPADDYVEGALDPTTLIVTNPTATFIWRVAGSSMVRAGVNDGDYVVVDRSLVPKAGDIVVAVIDGLSRLSPSTRVDCFRTARPHSRRRKSKTAAGVRSQGTTPAQKLRPTHPRWARA